MAFVVKVCKNLKDVDRDSTAFAKCKTPAKSPNTIRTPKFIQKVKKIINKKTRMSMSLIRSSGHSIGITVHEVHWCKSYLMWRKQKLTIWSMQCSCWPSSNIKFLEWFGVSLMWKTLIRTKRSTEQMIIGYAETLRTF